MISNQNNQRLGAFYIMKMYEQVCADVALNAVVAFSRPFSNRPSCIIHAVNGKPTELGKFILKQVEDKEKQVIAQTELLKVSHGIK